MLETLKSNKASAFFITIIMSVLFFAPLFFLPQGTNNQNFSYPFVKGIMQSVPNWVQFSLSFLSYLIAVWYGNFVVSKHLILGRGNHLSAYFIFILLAIGPNLLFLNIISVSCLLLIRFYDRCFEIQKSTKPNPLLFDASFLVSLLAIIYMPFILLLVLIWLAGIYSGNFSFKGLLLSFFTVFLAFYLFAGILYLTDVSFLPDFHVFSFYILPPAKQYTQVFFYLLLALILFALVPTLKVLRFSKVVLRNHLNFVLWSLPVLLVVFISTEMDVELGFSFLFFPLSIVLALFFIKMKKLKLANLALILFTILVASYQLIRVL